MILVSTKNVFAPGRSSGLAPPRRRPPVGAHRQRNWRLRYRVNMVAPDAIFPVTNANQHGPVGPSRVARGLDEKGLEDYYRNRNLLKAGDARPRNAVLFFATRQTPTTGATIPVDGGLPDTPP